MLGAPSVQMGDDLDLEALRTATGLMALRAVGGLTAAQAREVAQTRELGELDPQRLTQALHGARKLMTEHRQHRIKAVGFFDEAYPARLRDIPAAPNVLFVRGPVALLRAARILAIVGTREPTVFGESVVEMTVDALGPNEDVTVSGLALGCDGLAHKQSLQRGVCTVAVLAGGLDNVHPPEHRALARDILANGGALVSEWPVGVRTDRRRLVARNRLITGLAHGVLVAQTPVRSGTMHAARFAFEQERTILVPRPHNNHERSLGLRVLGELPGRELEGRVPAFAHPSRRMAARLGEAPVGVVVDRDSLPAALEALPVG